MYEVDLVGGPEDGHTYTMADLPPYIYFPYIPEATGWLTGPHLDMPVPVFETPKLVYRHVIQNLYLFMGIQD